MTGAASTASPTVLTIVEAVALSTAWLQRNARSQSIRSLVLKGPTLQEQGLRGHHVSSDVDLLVEPARFDEFVEILTTTGWTEFTETFASEQFVTHSRTFRRAGWPNSLDVHSSWPGFLASDEDVFEVLWERRAAVELAHTSCEVPDRNANLLLLALHSLRGTTSQPRHERELDGLRRIRISDEDRQDLATLARVTGSAAPLQDFLTDLGVRVDVDPSERQTPIYKEWQRKVAHAQGRTASWLIELQRAPWRRKAVVLRHGVWPTDHDLLAEHPDVPDRFWSKIWARIARLGGGIRQLPRVIPALRRR